MRTHIDGHKIEYKENMFIAEELMSEIATDSVEDSKRVIDTYNSLTEENRKAVNDIFISLCGYQLTTLAERFKND